MLVDRQKSAFDLLRWHIDCLAAYEFWGIIKKRVFLLNTHRKVFP